MHYYYIYDFLPFNVIISCSDPDKEREPKVQLAKPEQNETKA
jgi:hypothetical protein